MARRQRHPRTARLHPAGVPGRGRVLRRTRRPARMRAEPIASIEVHYARPAVHPALLVRLHRGRRCDDRRRCGPVLGGHRDPGPLQGAGLVADARRRRRPAGSVPSPRRPHHQAAAAELAVLVARAAGRSV
jgi:hypothetical protein